MVNDSILKVRGQLVVVILRRERVGGAGKKHGRSRNSVEAVVWRIHTAIFCLLGSRTMYSIIETMVFTSLLAVQNIETNGDKESCAQTSIVQQPHFT